MPQKKKATTKKGMKKSINNLCKALEVEKSKHSKASAIIGRCKQSNLMLRTLVSALKGANCALKNKLERCDYDRQVTDKYAAKLVKEVATIK